MSNWTTAEARLAATLPGYEVRANQQRLALSVEQALADGKPLAAQAGTGTGKSLAALIPAIHHARATGFPAVVATGTKALQDQYTGKDAPFLVANLGIENLKIVALKGRSNYACLAKLGEAKEEDVFGLKSLREELEGEDATGDMDTLVTELDMSQKWRVTATSEECPGKSDCPFGEICFAEKAKDAAREADVVIVNHALLSMDAVVRAKSMNEKGESVARILPEFSAVLVDEAHELEGYATNALGSEFASTTLSSIAVEIANFLGGDRSTVAGLMGASNTLFAALTKFLGRDKERAFTEADLVRHADQIEGCTNALWALRKQVVGVQIHGDDKKVNRRKRLVKKIDSLLGKFNDVIAAVGVQLVRWVQVDEKRGTVLKFAPLHVGEFLAEHLWAGRSSVLLSATLAMGSDFSYITGRLGIANYTSFDAGTPFDFAKKAAMFVPGGFEPKKDSMGWAAKVSVAIPRLVAAAGGRALLLFTSRRAMNDAYQANVDAIRDMGYTVLKQGDKPNPALVAEFKADATSVLFGLKSFMTGIDIQGDALRLVIVDKLPFAVPSDVIFAARSEQIDRANGSLGNPFAAGGSFWTLSMPEMALTLQQAFGRLIRTMDDEGVVAILDSRLLNTGYGKRMLRVLPPAKRLGSLPDAEAHLAEIKARRG